MQCLYAYKTLSMIDISVKNASHASNKENHDVNPNFFLKGSKLVIWKIILYFYHFTCYIKHTRGFHKLRRLSL